MTVALSNSLTEACDITLLSFFDPRPDGLEAGLESSISVRHLGKRLGPDPLLPRNLWRCLREVRPHIVHSHRYALPYLLPALAVLPPVPVVHTVHTDPTSEADWRTRVILRLLKRIAITPIALAPSLATPVSNIFRATARVIANGVDVSAFERSSEVGRLARAALDIEPHRFVIAVVARLSPEKNHATVIEVFQRFQQRFPEALLLLVGDGPCAGDLRDTVDLTEGSTPHVRFLGRRQDIAELLAATDVVTLFSTREGAPLSLLEAMAAGRPIVASHVGGIADLLDQGRCGLLVDPLKPEDLLAAWTRLAMDPHLRKSLADHGHERAKSSFDQSVMTSSYLELYHELSHEVDTGTTQ